jgi:hypothetical protein
VNVFQLKLRSEKFDNNSNNNNDDGGGDDDDNDNNNNNAVCWDLLQLLHSSPDLAPRDF